MTAPRSAGQVHCAEALRWAWHNGWRPRYPRGRRDGTHTWRSADKRLQVMLDVSGYMQVHQHAHDGWKVVLTAHVGCWQGVLDALQVHRILPYQFSSAARAVVARSRELGGPR